MRTDNLPIYRVTYELLKRITQNTRNFPRDLKPTLGENLRQETVDIIVYVYRANFSKDRRKEYTHVILEKVQTVEMMLRLCVDMQLISKSKHGNLIEMTDQIGKQAQGWAKSAK